MLNKVSQPLLVLLVAVAVIVDVVDGGVTIVKQDNVDEAVVGVVALIKEAGTVAVAEAVVAPTAAAIGEEEEVRRRIALIAAKAVTCCAQLFS
mmetsp:Transcript_12436/g.13317  ORF Transcript_12436/g.13317 Transcript_12436/m.13317 type:complete len:93 (+) Transcript_12436:97-375(+)